MCARRGETDARRRAAATAARRRRRPRGTRPGMSHTRLLVDVCSFWCCNRPRSRRPSSLKSSACLVFFGFGSDLDLALLAWYDLIKNHDQDQKGLTRHTGHHGHPPSDDDSQVQLGGRTTVCCWSDHNSSAPSSVTRKEALVEVESSTMVSPPASYVAAVSPAGQRKHDISVFGCTGVEFGVACRVIDDMTRPRRLTFSSRSRSYRQRWESRGAACS